MVLLDRLIYGNQELQKLFFECLKNLMMLNVKAVTALMERILHRDIRKKIVLGRDSGVPNLGELGLAQFYNQGSLTISYEIGAGIGGSPKYMLPALYVTRINIIMPILIYG